MLLLLFLSFPTYAQLPSTLGEQKTLVILVNFQDKTEQPFNSAYAQDVVFNQTNAYIQEVSYGQTWITGDVYGWFTIASSYTTCDMATIGNQARAAAANAGANLSLYSRRFYMFPANACPFIANSTIGGNPSDMWLKGQRDFMVISHEFGHNLGLWHSRSYDCGVESICANGIIDEYGDRFDLMGPSNTGYAAHFSAYQKERLGWLTVTDATVHGDYTLENYESVGGVRALKIAKATGEWYYVEKRSAVGYDSFLSGVQYDNVRNGVLIHVGRDSGILNPDLLDLTPATSSWLDPALTVSRSFVDPAANLGITLLSINPTVVRVTCAACVPPLDNTPPSVAITAPIGTVPRNTTVSVQATASDNIGIDRVELLVNGVLLCTDITAPYACNWNVPGKRNATYTLMARAYDAAGNLGTNSIVITGN